MEQIIGETTIGYSVTPDQDSYTLEVDIPPVAGINKTAFDSLVLTTVMQGAVLLHGSYVLDDPASFIKIPQLITR